MNRFEIALFLSTPLALMPERIRAIVAMLAAGTKSEATEARRAASPRPVAGGIAVIPIHGVVSQRGDMWDAIFNGGSASTQDIGAMLADAVNDPGVSQILLDIDSPGGSVYGVAELAAQIRSAREAKPVVAVANSLAASAAYWLACQASELYVTPGGEVGSIGVWQAHQDASAMLEAAGLKVTLISAGKYKTEGNPYQPLDSDAAAFMQSRVNDYYGDFVKDVAAGRRTTLKAVREGMGQGRVLGADAAKAENMVDGVATAAEVLRGMQSKAAAARSSRASTEDAARRARIAELS